MLTTTTLIRRSLIQSGPGPQFRLLSSLTSSLPVGGVPTKDRKNDDGDDETSPNHHRPQQQQRRSFYRSAAVRQADAAATAPAPSTTTTTTSSSPLLNRFAVTAEVTVSKILPAGLGWQSASLVADSLGYAGDSASFALTTGAGDALGVLAGHCLYYGLKKASSYDSSINMTRELQTGILLGSAAMMSGTAWQPLVNALQGANLSFNSVMAGTWVGCGLAFYAGLRAARTVYSDKLTHIEPPTYANSQTDAALSVAIGGATGFFVGTDAAYLPEQNFLLNYVGILDTTPDAAGCLLAGTSTSLGFCAAQSTLNMIYPAGKCWND